jgi:membrane associated rhomboid family serine protease
MATEVRSDGSLQRLKENFFLPLQLLIIPWVVEIVDQLLFGGRLTFVVIPRAIAGLPGIFLSAISHADFAHLIGNSIGFAIFSWIILTKSRKDYWTTLLLGWLGGGAACWLLGLSPAHGLSGVVYTLFGYLILIGWLEKRIVPLVISVVVLINYSYFIWGVLPTQPGVAWWGHLYGFLLGLFAAYGVYREPGRAYRPD